MMASISLQLNGRAMTVEAEPERRLLWVLRTELGLTGAKYGCGAGHCGSCMVVVEGRPVRSCITPLGKVAGKAVLTIEGLAEGDELHPLQQAFVEHGALQCGYCTPGMILAAWALLEENPRPTRAEVVDALENNLCRCAAHQRILAAVGDVAGPGGRP